MIETDIDWPEELPHPQISSHQLNPISPFRRTNMDSGRARSRRWFSSVPTIGEFVWIMTDVQARYFELWFKSALNDGVEWFNVPRKTPLGQSILVARFASMYVGPTLWGRDRWQYTAQLEIWERPTMPEGWTVLPPDWILRPDIFDIAMNREWPEA